MNTLADLVRNARTGHPFQVGRARRVKQLRALRAEHPNAPAKTWALVIGEEARHSGEFIFMGVKLQAEVLPHLTLAAQITLNDQRDEALGSWEALRRYASLLLRQVQREMELDALRSPVVDFSTLN